MQAVPSDLASLRGATLVLPVVAVGNVAQLAADLLINTLRLPRAARLDDDALLPAVGARPYPHVEGLATAMELYQAPGSAAGVAVAQQRAPAAPGTQAAFAERLAAWVQASGVKEVLVLGSTEATFRRDAQLVGSQLRYWAPEGAGDDAGLPARCAEAAGLRPLEPSFFEDRALEERLLQPWPLLRQLAAAGVPCAAVLCFSTEGDNLAEAFQMATAAAAAAGLRGPASGSSIGGTEAAPSEQQQRQAEWVPPASWAHVWSAPAAVW